MKDPLNTGVSERRPSAVERGEADGVDTLSKPPLAARFPRLQALFGTKAVNRPANRPANRMGMLADAAGLDAGLDPDMGVGPSAESLVREPVSRPVSPPRAAGAARPVVVVDGVPEPHFGSTARDRSEIPQRSMLTPSQRAEQGLLPPSPAPRGDKDYVTYTVDTKKRG